MTDSKRELIKAKKKESASKWYQSLSREKKDARNAYLRKKFKDNPWDKHYYSALTRTRSKSPKFSKYYGMEFSLTRDDVKESYILCSAGKMMRPSIDRIDPKRGYTKDNIRFIELAENARLGQLERGWYPAKTPAGNSKAMSNRIYRLKARIEKELEIKYLAREQAMLSELVAVYAEYLDLLKVEMDETASIANVHGWKSSRYEEGLAARKKIADTITRLMEGRTP